MFSPLLGILFIVILHRKRRVGVYYGKYNNQSILDYNLKVWYSVHLCFQTLNDLRLWDKRPMAKKGSYQS